MRFKLPKNSHAHVSIRRCLREWVVGGEKAARVEAYVSTDPKWWGWFFVRVFGRKGGQGHHDFLFFDRHVARMYEEASDAEYVVSDSGEKHETMLMRQEDWVPIVARRAGVTCSNDTEMQEVSFRSWPPRPSEPWVKRDRQGDAFRSRRDALVEAAIYMNDVISVANPEGPVVLASHFDGIPFFQFPSPELRGTFAEEMGARGVRAAEKYLREQLENVARLRAGDFGPPLGPFTFSWKKPKGYSAELRASLRRGVSPADVIAGEKMLVRYALSVAKQFQAVNRKYVASWKRFYGTE